jgi:hemoglobin
MGNLYEDVGGIDGLRRLSTAFYERVLADPLLAPVFADFTPTHVDHVAVWLAEVSGGPDEFTTRLGGHQALLSTHLGLPCRIFQCSGPCWAGSGRTGRYSRVVPQVSRRSP